MTTSAGAGITPRHSGEGRGRKAGNGRLKGANAALATSAGSRAERVYPRAWEEETGCIRDYLDMAYEEGMCFSTIDNDRYILHRYRRFLKDRFNEDLPKASWQEFRAYRNSLLETSLKKRTIKHYVDVIRRYYLVRFRKTGDAQALDTYSKIRVVGRYLQIRTTVQPHAPFSPETLRKILRAAASYKQIWQNRRLADSEDEVVIFTLLYTGGRNSFYGLRVKEVDFVRHEIRAKVKGGKSAVIPLHPKLAEVLQRHLATRRYTSPYLFRNSGDPTTMEGQTANKVNAWNACRRVRRAAGLKEPVSTYRFRKTLAVMGRELGLDVQQVQAILAHSSVVTTMDAYARPRLEEVKSAFSKIDLLKRRPPPPRPSLERTMAALRKLAPRGKEEAWATLVAGFVELFQVTGLGEESVAVRNWLMKQNRHMRRRGTAGDLA